MDRPKSIDDIITITPDGLNTLDYADIVQVLYRQYRQIYGYDIELDPRSADGRFILSVATIINSGVDIIKQLYNNLNPNTAIGYFLDILCSLTNVQRLPATKSAASVQFINLAGRDLDFSSINKDKNNWNLIDDGGNEWTPIDDLNFSVIPNGTALTLRYECSAEGPITTTQLKWETLIPSLSNLSISIDAFEVGSEEESDADLRYRRGTTSNNGITINESIKGNLLDVTGVKSVYVKSFANNQREDPLLWLNNKSYAMTPHSTAILIRYDKVNEPNEEKIGAAIQNYLTPGISTDIIGIPDSEGKKSYSFMDSSSHIISTFYWYRCYPVSPTITITLAINQNYTPRTDSLIANQLLPYLNSLEISYRYTVADLMSVIQSADPKYQGISTFFVTEISIANADGDGLANKGTYFDYGSGAGGWDIKILSGSDSQRVISIGARK